MARHPHPGVTARFAVSLHPEIFYALQVAGNERPEPHARWKSLVKMQFPSNAWPAALPSSLWPAVADVVDMDPTTDFSVIAAAVEDVPTRQLQERLLLGLFHYESAVADLLDRGLELVEVVGTVPRAKREWLAHMGLYPADPTTPVAAALARVVHEPEEFRNDIVQTLRGFWDATFAETWRRLQPALEASVAEKKRRFDTCSFQQFIRHTLLPIEFDEKKQCLRALRGGYELAMKDIGRCTFTPSVFNDSRFWTDYTSAPPHSPWFPYCEPDLDPYEDTGVSEPAPDIALVFRALGDTTRFALVSLLGRHPRSAVELAAMLSVSKPTISHHIHILRSAGLIHETNHGASVLISLRRNTLEQLSELAVARIFESREPLELAKSRRET